MKKPSHLDILLKIAKQIGTPTYVYFEEKIRSQCKKFRQYTKDLPASYLYAMKANFHPAILQIIKSEGFGVDTVSLGELLLAQKIGFPKDKILYSPNHIAPSELKQAIKTGVLMNLGEPQLLEELGKQAPGSSVCLRLNPKVGAGHHEYVVTAGSKTKFGISENLFPEVKEIITTYDLKVIGIHQHIGSGFLDATEYWKAIQVLLGYASEFPSLQFLNFGGGLGIPYESQDSSFDFENFATKYIPNIIDWIKTNNPSINVLFEPGRYIVAESGVLLTAVTSKKFNGQRSILGTDSGQNHLIRPMLYKAFHEIANLSNPNGLLEKYDITGNICETGDKFASDRLISTSKKGDFLAILDTGAYGMSMASWYNLRTLPAEVLVKPDGTFEVITQRQSENAFIDTYLASVKY